MTAMEFVDRIKFRALAWVVAILLAIVATITFVGAPWLPIVGVGVAALVVSINRVAEKLDRPRCLSCGTDMSGQPVGVHGSTCPSCGAVSLPPVAARAAEAPATLPDDDDAHA